MNIYFAVYLHYHNSIKLVDLTLFIYNKKTIYIPEHKGLKLIKLSSIITKISALRKCEKEEYKREQMTEIKK